MKKAIIMLVVLFVAPAALAAIPTIVQFQAEWTPATQPNWVVTKNKFDPPEEVQAPHWESDTVLYIDNWADPERSKYLWLEIDYTSYQYTVPYPDLVVTPTATLLGVSTCGNSMDVTWLWKIDPQPPFEKITFPDAHYKGLENIYRIEVGIYCTSDADFPEPATMSLLALGGLAILRRKKK